MTGVEVTTAGLSGTLVSIVMTAPSDSVSDDTSDAESDEDAPVGVVDAVGDVEEGVVEVPIFLYGVGLKGALVGLNGVGGVCVVVCLGLNDLLLMLNWLPCLVGVEEVVVEVD